MTTEKYCTGSTHSLLLETYLTPLKAACKGNNPVLDLACGQGRNGLYLTEHGLPVVFADKSTEALATIKPFLNTTTSVWAVDFEKPNDTPLAGKSYSAIMVFRYLYRPLFDVIKQAIAPGGLIIYETFTVEQARLGRPKNPNFLLKANELHDVFNGWDILHYFEGMDNGSAIAQIVAMKPCAKIN